MIDMSTLPAPAVIEELDFETILQAAVADLKSRDKAYNALLESDPAYKQLEVAAYRELLLRQRINSAALATMLAYATGSDLDVWGGNFGVTRLLITPADTSASPPVEAVYEGDDDFRYRIQMSFEGLTTAGSRDSYIYHGLSADGDVKDIQPVSPTPGAVTVYVLSRTGTGLASDDLLTKVNAELNADKIRPLTDNVTVQSAAIVNYAIAADLVIMPGPDAGIVQKAAIEAATTYADAQRKIGYDINLSGLYAALHQPGVSKVNLTTPAANITIGDGQASHCTGITVTIAGGTDV